MTILAPKCDRLQPYRGHESQKDNYFFHFCSSIVYIVLPKVNFSDGLVGFIGEKFCWNTKIPTFWRFWPQNVTVYRPTLVMNRKIIIMFFTFAAVTYILCYLMVIFGGLVEFIVEKFCWNTKIPIFWRFWP